MASKSNNPKVKRSLIRRILGRARYLAGGPLRLFQQLLLRPFSWIQGGPAPAIARLHKFYELSPEIVLAGYVQGSFPTGEPDNSIVWHCPEERAVIGTSQVHVSKRLRGYLNRTELRISYNQTFEEVMHSCADREKTWITPDIIRVFSELHDAGFAHSVEAWNNDRLVGGGYGVALGKMFFLESMFCNEDHASKIAFVRLAEQLKTDGFESIDCQFLTEHWRRFGAVAVARNQFQNMVAMGLQNPARFSAGHSHPAEESASKVDRLLVSADI